MNKDDRGNPVPKKPKSRRTLQTLGNRGPVGIDPSRADRIALRFKKPRVKIGNAKTAPETGLTIAEVCSIVEEENRETMKTAVEARDKLLQVRPALIAMRGNLNQGDLEQTIKDIGTIVSRFQGVNLESDE